MITNDKKTLIMRCCGLAWLLSVPGAFGMFVISEGDFTQLGALMNSSVPQEYHAIIKTILNGSMNLHVLLSLPAMLCLNELTIKKDRVDQNVRCLVEGCRMRSSMKQFDGNSDSDGINITYHGTPGSGKETSIFKPEEK